jgi:hypothetical protein
MMRAPVAKRAVVARTVDGEEWLMGAARSVLKRQGRKR